MLTAETGLLRRIRPAEILTGKKTVPADLLKPVLKARHESLSER